jgi:2OG-Fe(II) oxygenase superfamily
VAGQAAMIDIGSGVQVVDDIFAPAEIERVFQTLTAPRFEWFFGVTRDKTVSNDNYALLSDDHTFEQFQLTRWFVVNGEWAPADEADLMKSIAAKIAARIGNPTLRVDRIKANLQTRTLSNRKYNTPHVDNRLQRHIVAIYYVNDADGRTVVFANKEKPLKVLKEVKSKAGRVVIFDGNLLHAGSHPRRSDYRMVINFNFLI